MTFIAISIYPLIVVPFANVLSLSFSFPLILLAVCPLILFYAFLRPIELFSGLQLLSIAFLSVFFGSTIQSGSCSVVAELH